jgi:hypothetical protein
MRCLWFAKTLADFEINDIAAALRPPSHVSIHRPVLRNAVRLLRARRSLLFENLVLRQQLAVLKRRHPRPRLDLVDKLFWVASADSGPDGNHPSLRSRRKPWCVGTEAGSVCTGS